MTRREEIKQKIIDFCHSPRTFDEINEKISERSDRIVRNYVRELIEEERLNELPRRNRKIQYLKYQPSPYELATVALEREILEGPYKIFTLDPAFSGIGKTNFNTINIHLKNKAILQFLPAQLLEDWITLQTYIHGLEDMGVTTQPYLDIAFQRIHMHAKVIYEVLDQIICDEKFGSEVILEKLFGKLPTRSAQEVRESWQRLLKTQIIEGDYHALDHITDPDEEV